MAMIAATSCCAKLLTGCATLFHLSAYWPDLGGDEFGICMVFEPEFPETVDRVAEDLIEALARPVTIGDIDHSVTASIGIARPEIDCDSIDMLIRRADIALYAAKKNGRNGFCWFESGMEVELRTRNSLEADIRAAIPNDEFVPYFEQQIDLAHRRTCRI